VERDAPELEEADVAAAGAGTLVICGISCMTIDLTFSVRA
jgi:hypothetical protein